MHSKKQFLGLSSGSKDFPLGYSPAGLRSCRVMLLACPSVTQVCSVSSRWNRGTGYEETEKEMMQGATRATKYKRKFQIKTCIWSCCLPCHPSHEPNRFQNQSAAAGAGWGFHSSSVEGRNKSPKATAAFTCRTGHMGIVWLSPSPGASLVSESGPALKMPLLSCFSFQTHTPGQKKKVKKRNRKGGTVKNQTSSTRRPFSEGDLTIRARLPQAQHVSMLHGGYSLHIHSCPILKHNLYPNTSNIPFAPQDGS